MTAIAATTSSVASLRARRVRTGEPTMRTPPVKACDEGRIGFQLGVDGRIMLPARPSAEQAKHRQNARQPSTTRKATGAHGG
jgi:hypothetical protein